MRNNILIGVVLLFSFTSYSQDFLNFYHDGIWRDYILYLPDGLEADAPLLFVLHGYTDQAIWAMEYTEMNDLADQEGFAVCYPSGTLDDSGERFWNVGYDFHWNETVDDIDFLKQLAQELQNAHNLDPERTFCTGFSNGGDMCFKIACEAFDTFKAVAPVAGAMMEVVHEVCDANNPIPIFMTNGTADPITLWDGDMANVDGWGAYHDVVFGMEFFSNANLCTDVVIDTVPNYVVWDGSFVVREKRSNGVNGNRCWLYKVVGDGHTWPGYDGNQDIHLSTDIWEFFSLYNPAVANDIEDFPAEPKLFSKWNISDFPLEYEVLTLQGKVVQQGTVNTVAEILNFESLHSGIYLLRAGNDGVLFCVE